MIPIIVISLLFILLVVFCVLSAKNWHWSNIVFLILCYIAGVAACIALSQVLDRRSKALALVKTTEMEAFGLSIDSDNDGIDDAIDADVEGKSNGPDADGDGISDNKTRFALESQAKYAEFGSPNSLTYSPNCLRGLSERYNLQQYGRGDIWKSGTPSAVGQNRVFQFQTPRPEGSAAEDSSSSLRGRELYAFVDSVFGKEKYIVPTTFIGALRVIDETAETLTLEPVFTVSRSGLDNVGEGVTWTLFERMPADGHGVFLGDRFDPTSDDLKDEEITKFRRQLEDLMSPARLGFDFNNPENEIARAARIDYERFIDRICFDGMSLARIEKWIEQAAERQSGDFKADPEETFLKLEFTADADFPFLVDDDGNVEDEGAFSVTGQALDKSLHNEKSDDVRFKKGDIVLIDEVNAESGYSREDLTQIQALAKRDESISVKELDKIFVRRIYDFPQMLRDYESQIEELNKATLAIEVDMQVSLKTNANLQAQEAERQEIIGKLQMDETNLKRDVALIAQELAVKQAEAEALQRRIEKLEADIRKKSR